MEYELWTLSGIQSRWNGLDSDHCGFCLSDKPTLQVQRTRTHRRLREWFEDADRPFQPSPRIRCVQLSPGPPGMLLRFSVSPWLPDQACSAVFRPTNQVRLLSL